MQYESFLKADNGVFHIDEISSVDTSLLESMYQVTVITKTGHTYIANELNAIELIMQLRPGALEGKRLIYAKNKWLLHNFIGHPLMNIFALCGLYKQAFWIHEVTVPKPIGIKRAKK
jgi:hypothetical protein